MYKILSKNQISDEYRKAVHDDHFRKMIADGTLANWRKYFNGQYERLSNVIYNDSDGLLIAVGEDESLVGYLVFVEIKVPRGLMVEILALRVIESERSRGLGTKLVTLLVDRCPGRQLMVAVGSGEGGAQARRIYEKAGFQKTSEIMELTLDL